MSTAAAVPVPGGAERDDASLRVVARLLVVGLAAGTLIGAVVVPVTVFDLSDGQSWEAVGAATGGLGGLVLGVLTQLVIAAVLGVLRRARPATPAAVVRRVAQLLACVAAGSAALTAAALLDSGPPATAVALGLALALAALVGRAWAPWCLRPWTSATR